MYFVLLIEEGGGNEKYSMREGMEGFRHIMIKEIRLIIRYTFFLNESYLCI